MADDDEVVSSAKAGDPAAWQQLYTANAGRLLLWLRTRPVADAAVSPDDIAAETWMTAARRLGEFTGTGEDFVGWLFGIARNVWSNQSRRGARRAHQSLDAVEERRAPGESPDVVIPGADWVRSVLSGLPKRERDVIGCMEVVGLDAESTARALGISPITVRVTRHRALRRLRETLRSHPATHLTGALVVLLDR